MKIYNKHFEYGCVWSFGNCFVLFSLVARMEYRWSIFDTKWMWKWDFWWKTKFQEYNTYNQFGFGACIQSERTMYQLICLISCYSYGYDSKILKSKIHNHKLHAMCVKIAREAAGTNIINWIYVLCETSKTYSIYATYEAELS